MNKLMVISGGTKGIGRALVEKFSSQSFDVAASARNLPDLEQLKLEIEARYKNNIYITSGDMSIVGDVNAFAGSVTALDRPVDVLINNAGYFVPGEICTEPEGTLEKMINANLYSAYFLTRGIVPSMKKNLDGHIFNMCSVASFKAYPNGGSYAITKFALLGFSKCLREELKLYNIRVTSIIPGATQTASWEGSELPDSRFMKPEDVAETIFSAHALSKRSVIEEIIMRPQLGDI
jgi:short-subunit dehydrogenase